MRVTDRWQPQQQRRKQQQQHEEDSQSGSTTAVRDSAFAAAAAKFQSKTKSTSTTSTATTASTTSLTQTRDLESDESMRNYLPHNTTPRTHGTTTPNNHSNSNNKFTRPPPVAVPSNASTSSTSSSSLENTSHTRVWVRPPSTVRRTRGTFHNPHQTGEHDAAVAAQQALRKPWAWKRGWLMEQSKQELRVRLIPTPEQPDSTNLVFPTTSLGQHVLLTNDFVVDDQGHIVPPDDLITLTHLNEPAVLESLQARYQRDVIYTNTGAVLLALNPFQNVRGLYGEAAMKSYWQRAESGQASAPHVYGIADASFRSMRRELEAGHKMAHQSILVSGESGAGKTVTTKFVMKYLAALSQRSGAQKKERAYIKAVQPTTVPLSASQDEANLSSLTLLSGSGNNASIEAQVLQSNPILESFGNARTVRNDNSSRFGKFIEIQFSHAGQLVGASIETYLLEKVRLVHQSAGERNYHIFYELLGGGMDARQLSHYFIAKTARPQDFKLTASGTYDRRDGVSDQETYQALVQACRAMQFDSAVLHSIFSVTAALLHASNLTLVDDEDDCCKLDLTNVHLAPVCHLLGVTPEQLEKALCQQTLTVGRNSTVTKRLSLEKAIKGLEALLKAVYGALFQYLVQRINDSVAYRDESGHPPVASVRVLDIFGFESFYMNSFEQLCINYCNETLQQQFNAFVLKNEQAEYEREGIEWSFIAFEENQDVLDLIDKRGQGILSLLDDQCRAPGPSDKAFLLQVYKTCQDHDRFSVTRQQEANQQFAIQHYAGKVEYTTYGFVEKNRDELSKEGTELVKNSQNPFMQELATIMEQLHEPQPNGSTANTTMSANPRSLRRSDSSVGRPTVGGQFRKQLRHLRCKIDETTPHYIRCLKPNDVLVPDYFDPSVVAEQLRCGGILEAVRVARAGFTQHYIHQDFVRRYRTLAWREMAKKEGPSKSPYGRGSISDDVSIERRCKDLIRILFRKIHELENEEAGKESRSCEPALSCDSWDERSSPAKAKSYSYISSAPRPSWTKTPSPRTPNSKAASEPKLSTWKNTTTSSEHSKKDIQLGKTKVFLRHKAFEALERIRSKVQSNAATMLNSLFRRYLARCAYIPYRNAFRQELSQKRQLFEHFDNNDDEQRRKESKEQDFDDDDNKSTFLRFRHAMRNSDASRFATESMVDKWVESQVREAIHNPLPRHEWGKAAPTHGTFQWVLSDGLWVRGNV